MLKMFYVFNVFIFTLAKTAIGERAIAPAKKAAAAL
jgi:hypothetical protein